MSAPSTAGASTSASSPGIDECAVTAFLIREARLLDEWQVEEWLELWTDEARYWVPAGADDIDPRTHVSLIYDDRTRLGERIFRLTNAGAHSQEPRSRSTHYLSGIEVDVSSAPMVYAHAAMLLVEVRGDRQEIYGGRVNYTVRLDGCGALKLVEKKIMLTRSDTPLGNLTFLL